MKTLLVGDVMARSRNIKPGFFLNDVLSEIEPLGRLLFAGLWTIADKAGRLRDSPKKIKACILPYDDCDVNNLLNELWKRKFITRYVVDNEGYIAVINWKKHQNPHMKEVESEIPEPEEEAFYSEQELNEHHTSTMQEQVLHETSPADSLNLIPLTLNLIPDSSTGASTVQKNPKKSKVAVIKKTFGEKVHLSEAEYEKLVKDNGKYDTDEMIAILDNWYCSKGKPPNKSDYHCMVGKGWVLSRLNEDRQKQSSKPKTGWINTRTPNQSIQDNITAQWLSMHEEAEKNGQA